MEHSTGFCFALKGYGGGGKIGFVRVVFYQKRVLICVLTANCLCINHNNTHSKLCKMREIKKLHK